MQGISFSNWLGIDGIEQYIVNKTGCKPYTGAGIFIKFENNTAILKSVDDTYYYDDDLRDIENVKYTLFGHNGDQDENGRKFNEPLLNKEKTQHIFLYRVKIDGKKKKYIWYGKYEIGDKNTKLHIGEDRIMRNIIVLSLKRIGI